MKKAFPTGTIKRGEPGGVICRPEEDTGMDLRDYFAAKALEGMVSGRWKKENRTPEPEEFAEHAYKMADAMLEQRQR